MMNRDSVNRGRQLRFAREYRGYTQTQLCKELGLSQSALSKHERGFEGLLTTEKEEEIMKFFDWPMNWLDVYYPRLHSSLNL